MEVLQDTYKDTKIGRIPKDWEVMKLGELCETITKGTTPTTNGYSYLTEGINFVKVESIDSFGTFKKKMFAHIGKDCYESFKRSQLKEGDILISIAGALGRTAIVTDDILPANTNQAVGILRLKDKSHNTFIRYFLDSYFLQKFIERINVASAQANLNLGHLDKFNIVFPPLLEQQKIAAILSTVDEQISTTDKIIEKSKELKKGLMQRFFLNKAYMIMSLGKLEKTELMPIRFNQLGKILTGTTPPTANNEYYDSEDYMFIGPADLGKVKDVKSSKKYISVKGFDVTRKLPENALMVVCIGATIGKIGLTTEPCATNQQVNTIVPKDEYSARYLYYVIGGLKKYLLGFAGDTATPQLNKTDFGKVVTFIHKSKSERTKIATILSEADAKIEKEQTQKVQLQALKKGLMQQLLTGKKRVKV